MKRKRALLFATVTVIVTATGVSLYGYRASQQTRVWLATRAPVPAAARYEKLHEALERSGKAEPAGAGNETADEPKSDDPETGAMVEAIERARALFARHADTLAHDAAWAQLWSELRARPVAVWSAHDWERLNRFLAQNGALLADARALAADAGPVFPLDLSEGYATLLPHLSDMRRLAEVLQASAIAAANAGDTSAATVDLMAGLRLADRLRDEPVILSQLVRLAMERRILEGVASAFPEGQIPPDFAAEFARYAAASDLADSLARAWSMEQEFGLDYLGDLMGGGWQESQTLWNSMWPAEERPGGALGSYLYTSPLARPWQHFDAHSFNQFMGEFERALAMPYYEARPVVEQIERQIDALPFTRVVTRNLTPSMYSVLEAVAGAQARQQILLLGTALESYAGEHGAYPTRLEDIQGQAYGASIIDPFTGVPFVYEAGDGFFALYTNGPESVEDDRRLQTGTTGRIAWRDKVHEKRGTTHIARRELEPRRGA